MLPELVPRPSPIPYLAGFMNFRGRIVPVMDLEVRLGFPASRYRIHHKVLLIDWNDSPFGLIVHDVLDVVEVLPNRLSAPSSSVLSGKAGEGILSGETWLGEEMVSVLNPRGMILPLAGPEPAFGAEWTAASDRAWVFFPDATEEERAILRERARALREHPEVEDPAEIRPHAVFELEGEHYGVELFRVSEFTESRDVTPIPNCPDHIVGYINLRGEVLTVIDIRGILNPNLSRVGGGCMVMVLRLKDLAVGISVDRVMDIVYPKRGDLLPVPDAVSAERRELLKWVFHHGERVLGVPDFEKILALERLVVNEEV
jgi:purine-binding chemotaxis protein CheW